MDGFRNLVPHPNILFPSSRQSRNASRTSHRLPSRYDHREHIGSDETIHLLRNPVVEDRIGPLIYQSPLAPLSLSRRQERGDGYDYSPNLTDDEAENTRNRRREQNFLRHRRNEEFARRNREANDFRFRTDRGANLGIETRQREREIEVAFQRRVKDVMEEMQEMISQEQDRIEDEWMRLETAWVVIEEARRRDTERERERELRGWELVERNPNGERDGAAINRSGRRYTRWNEGRWENMGVGNRDRYM